MTLIYMANGVFNQAVTLRLLAIAARLRQNRRMAHCPYDLLADISGALDRLRALPGLVERKPGIFYIKGDGFLHFHIKDGERWADVKPQRGGKWERIPVPLNASNAVVARFTRTVEKAHKSYVSG